MALRTAYSPKTHVELASKSAGVKFGHVPGHKYHDVDVVVSHAKNGAIRVHVVESWGSAQGYDEEHGRREVVGRGETVKAACREAQQRAESAGINAEFLSQALSMAEDEAEEMMADSM